MYHLPSPYPHQLLHSTLEWSTHPTCTQLPYRPTGHDCYACT